MKLYTEEQVLESMWKLVHPFSKGKEIDEIYKSLTPIELPTDEEIEDIAPYVPKGAHDYYVGDRDGFIIGAKWMRDKIQGGNK